MDGGGKYGQLLVFPRARDEAHSWPVIAISVTSIASRTLWHRGKWHPLNAMGDNIVKCLLDVDPLDKPLEVIAVAGPDLGQSGGDALFIRFSHDGMVAACLRVVSPPQTKAADQGCPKSAASVQNPICSICRLAGPAPISSGSAQNRPTPQIQSRTPSRTCRPTASPPR